MCKLNKSFYCLRQVPEQWHENFNTCLLENGFKCSECDKCLYFKNIDDLRVIICLYDDLLIFGSNLGVVEKIKMLLKSYFDMKDLGVANVILGMKISRLNDGISLDQTNYIENY